MGKYDYFLDEKINLGKSYRSYKKIGKKKRAPQRAARKAQLVLEKERRDADRFAAGSEKYHGWPEFLI